MNRTVLVVEVSNATEEEIQIDLGNAFSEICEKNKGTGITTSVLKEKSGQKVINFINGEGDLN